MENKETSTDEQKLVDEWFRSDYNDSVDSEDEKENHSQEPKELNGKTYSTLMPIEFEMELNQEENYGNDYYCEGIKVLSKLISKNTVVFMKYILMPIFILPHFWLIIKKILNT